jgi:repressor LexA
MAALTPTQSNIFSFILEHFNMDGIPPTLDEIASSFEYKSINTVRQHLRLIENKGYIKVHHGKSRGIQVLKSFKENPPICSSHGIQIPLVGSIAAGIPITAIQEAKEHLMVPPGFLSPGEYFALRVTGESMKNVGIHTGDIVLIRCQNAVTNGEIAVVIIENEATLKRFFKYSDRILLQSENPDYPDIVFSKSNCCNLSVAGKLAGLLKKIV